MAHRDVIDRERAAFIVDHLQNVGTLRRVDLQERFKLSASASAVAIRRFLISHPHMMIYNPNRKAYLPASNPPKVASRAIYR